MLLHYITAYPFFDHVSEHEDEPLSCNLRLLF
jgi:hypothetical protein